MVCLACLPIQCEGKSPDLTRLSLCLQHLFTTDRPDAEHSASYTVYFRFSFVLIKSFTLLRRPVSREKVHCCTRQPSESVTFPLHLHLLSLSHAPGFSPFRVGRHCAATLHCLSQRNLWRFSGESFVLYCHPRSTWGGKRHRRVGTAQYVVRE